jgi:hypothetical protein
VEVQVTEVIDNRLKGVFMPSPQAKPVSVVITATGRSPSGRTGKMSFHYTVQVGTGPKVEGFSRLPILTAFKNNLTKSGLFRKAGALSAHLGTQTHVATPAVTAAVRTNPVVRANQTHTNPRRWEKAPVAPSGVNRTSPVETTSTWEVDRVGILENKLHGIEQSLHMLARFVDRMMPADLRNELHTPALAPEVGAMEEL